jgi:hypothetical protein
MGPTPVKSLRASASVLNRSAAQDAAWVREVEAAKERRRQREAAGASTAVGPDPAVAGLEPARTAAPGPVEAEPKALPSAEATVEVATEEAAAEATAEGAAPAPEQEVAPARELQPQQDLLVRPVGMTEGGAVEASAGAPEAAAPEVEVPAAGAPAVGAPASEPPSGKIPAAGASTAEVPAPEAQAAEGPVTAEGQAPVVIVLDDALLDKGKEIVGAEEGEATSRAEASAPARGASEAGPSSGPGGAPAGASSSWPDFAALAIARAEEEIPRWGGPPLAFKDAANLDGEPILVLNDRDEVHRWQYLEGVRQHLARLLSVASDAVTRGMLDATEV